MRYEPKDIQITFREIPDCICIPINIYGCTFHCPGCFEKYLWNESDTVGEELDETAIKSIFKANPGADCICFMGGMDLGRLVELAYTVKHDLITIAGKHPRVAWYTGYDELPHMIKANLDLFNYIKLGHYDSKLGPLNKRTTNQRLYQVVQKPDKVSYKGMDTEGKAEFENLKFLCKHFELVDITKEMQRNQP